MDDSCGIFNGRPYDGVGILIRKKLLPYSNFHTYDDKRLLSVEVNIENVIMLFLNVYMPFQCEDNYDEYMEK